MSMDIIQVHDRMPSFWTEGMEVTIGDLARPAAVDPHFNRVRDLTVFWRGEAEIDAERGQPAFVNTPFYSVDYLGWGSERVKISENMREEFMKLRELIDALENYAPAEHRGLMGEQVLARGAFDRLDDKVDEVLPGLEESNSIVPSEDELVVNLSDAYSEFIDNNVDWRLEDGPLPYILDMAA